jgi:hypothetical protein
MSGSNLPPGVSGNEPQITGEWKCADCGALLPEDGWWIVVDDDGEHTLEASDGDEARERHLRENPEALVESVRSYDGEVCPDYCPEPDYDDMAERRAEARADFLEGRDGW